MKHAVLISLAVSTASLLPAQSNTVVGLDGRLETLDNITYWGRRGAAHPGGEAGLSMRNTMCNPGTVSIPWYAQMQENHPKFGFLITRITNDRMVQISDRSYCKHAFTSASTSGACGPCNGIGGNLMGVTCSDTYSAGNNAGRNNLGPPAEINPWLGTWPALGSYFDQGDPNVGPPGNNDGVQSPIVVGSDAVKNRVTVKEADMLVAGSTYFYGIQLIHQGEAVANRWDNIKSRGFTPTWTGSTWTVANSGPGETFGSVLQHWTGADVNSGGNGNDDGRFFVASKVTALGGGNYHYEYAVHNVDNSRAGASLRLPIDAGAVASNFSFRDIDANALNNWTGARVGNEVVFTAPANNPLEWNTIYNFGFDANFPPGNAGATIDEARVGPGALFVTVAAKAPSGSTFAQVTPVGTGCGGNNCQASFYQFFSPASAFDLANSSWTMTFNGSNYTLGPGAGSYVAPAGTNLTMSDDTTVSVALPFALPFPGGSTNTLWVCSNGFISSANNGSSYTPSSGGFLAGQRTWAALWHDLNPTTGMVRADVSAAVARISYTAVPNFSGGGTATFQYQFFPNGTVHVIYQAVTAAGNDYLVGYTPGGGAADPGSWDISAGLAGGLSLCSGASIPNLALASSARPILGTTINLVTSNVPAGSLLGISILSTNAIAPPLNLGIINMPNCYLYQTLDVVNTFPATSPSASASWVIPNVPSASGLVVNTQSAIFKPSFNPFGAATTNGLQLLLGIQ
ncbi:MAG: hypothetical protein WAT39_09020 [Planctomycetota bacterium]